MITAKVVEIANEVVTIINKAAGAVGYVDAAGTTRTNMLGSALAGLTPATRTYDPILTLEKLEPEKVHIFVSPGHQGARTDSTVGRTLGNPAHKIAVVIAAKIAAAPDDLDAFNAEIDAYSGLAERVGYIFKSLSGRTLPTTKAALETVEFPWFLHAESLRTLNTFFSETVLTFRAGESTP